VHALFYRLYDERVHASQYIALAAFVHVSLDVASADWMALLPLTIAALLSCSCIISAQDASTVTVTPDFTAAGQRQTIDGFGAHQGSDTNVSQAAWFRDLFFDDIKCSIYRVDLSPALRTPFSDESYWSPNFGGHGALALPGPDNNNVRTYTNVSDYTRQFAGGRARIAVMGPNIAHNIQYFDYSAENKANGPDGTFAEAAKDRAAEDFKLIGSFWSPVPWVKVSSGSKYKGQAGGTGHYPTDGTPLPAIWRGCFSGGMVDVSGESRAEFDDSSQPGGSGPTSALTQLARSTAAYLKGYQDRYGVKFYAVSLQNELAFDEFYNSCAYGESFG
jgi:O-glycosyl hydrolase